MNILKKYAGEWLHGHSFPQEYLCMAENGLEEEAHFMQDGQPASPLFLGYFPVIAASTAPLTTLRLVQKNFMLGDISFSLSEKKFAHLPGLKLYTGNSSRQYFLPLLKRMLIRMRYRFSAKRKGPMYLPWNIYNQARLMYAVPRKISLIVTGENGSYNVCPTDLHGQADENHYLISLRKNGKLNEQVMRYKKLLLADMDALMYKDIYALGKNHMQEPKTPEHFSILSGDRSAMYGFPLPVSCISYMELELELVETTDIGIHHVHLFKINHRENIKEGNRLMHIHAHYAAYRKSKKYNDRFLFR